MATRAINFLRRKKIPFAVVTYDHHEKGAKFAAAATGFALAKTVKSLVVELEPNTYCLALMPGDRQLDLKSLARVFKVKRTAMADAATARRLTGYLVGGISPFGTTQKLPVVMDSSIHKFDEVLINAGQRGTMLIMAPSDIVQALGCQAAAIAKKE